ncbi:MAG: hypothetical protein OXE95_05115 [Chloroflexi bacterium]|nr:hypothetical protein [Chloroflexota bacterium]MCY4246943.1 hypothetical protein [Chloroflexota bacterium]
MANEDHEIYSEDDSIKSLGFSVRVQNALLRSYIETIGQLVYGHEKGELWNIRNLGEKGIAEIDCKLANIDVARFNSLSRSQDVLPFSPIGENLPFFNWGPPQVPVHEVVAGLQSAISKQLNAGLLHPDIAIYGEAIGSLVKERNLYSKDLYLKLSKVLSSHLNVTQELEALLSPLPSRELDIIRQRHGFSQNTLEIIATQIGVTRERVRQLEKNALNRVVPIAKNRLLIRFQSALLFADDLDISYENWSQKLLETGLLGVWTDERFTDIDPIEMMVALCQAIRYERNDLEFPHYLEVIIRLHKEGMSAVPARDHFALQRISPEEKRFFRRHKRHSGAVSVDWLAESEHINLTRTDLIAFLEALEYKELSDGWYFNVSDGDLPGTRGKDNVFHNTIIKLSTFCGPVSVNDIYFGLEHALERPGFPVPPPCVLEKVLAQGGYTVEDGLWYWQGDENRELSRGEEVILEAIQANDGVAHHSQLASAILAGGMSYASIAGTLKRSPLFDNFEHSLYKLRASNAPIDSILRAHEAVADIPLNLETSFDVDGNIIVSANLSSFSLGHGTVTSSHLPTIVGSWFWTSEEGEEIDVTATSDKISGLRAAMQSLECQVGDRIALAFNVDNRQVSISKVVG